MIEHFDRYLKYQILEIIWKLFIGLLQLFLLIASIFVIFYFQKSANKCEFGKNASNCNNTCETDSDCKFEIGYCVNIGEKVFLPEGAMPAYEELTCRC